jgi:predicted AlkP superfamily phosphohydrolase/phosphomutase
LRQLFEDCPPVRLRSSADTLTSSVWPTFATGSLPGEHGAYYPMQWDPASMTLRRVTDQWLYYEPFWYDLARRGRRVTVLDAPFCHPSRLPSGVEVLNWGSQECLGPFHANRPELAREIQRRFGRHPMGAEIPVEQTAAKLEQIRGNLVRGAEKKAQLARYLMESTEWDLFLTVFSECHRGGHIFWPPPAGSRSKVPPGALEEVYQAVDRAIDHLLKRVDFETTTVIVFSVHGMRANYTQEQFLLELMGRVNATHRGERFSREEEAAPKRQSGLMRGLREALPPQLQYHVARMLPAGVRDWVVRRAFLGPLDWKQTLGFGLLGSGESYLRYNLAGRELEGVEARDSEAFQKYERHLTQCLEGLTNSATGEPVVKELVKTGERYPGPRSKYLPDLTILWEDQLPVPEVESEALGKLHGQLGTGRTGDHQETGFYVVAGNRNGLEDVPPLEHIVDFAGFVKRLLA